MDQCNGPSPADSRATAPGQGDPTQSVVASDVEKMFMRPDDQNRTFDFMKKVLAATHNALCGADDKAHESPDVRARER